MRPLLPLAIEPHVVLGARAGRFSRLRGSKRQFGRDRRSGAIVAWMSSRSNSSRPPGKPHGKLTAQQARFAEQYVVDLNGTQAAIRAGYSPTGAASQANALLHKSQVVTRVQELQAQRTERAKIDADFVLARLVEEVQADVADLFEADGTLRPVETWPLPFRRGLIAGIKVNELWETGADGRKAKIGVTREVVFSDRIKRLELLGKHVNVQAFKEKLSLGAENPLRALYD